MLTLTNARLFDGHKMLGGRHSVALDGTTIAAIDGSIGQGDEVVDLDGMTLMPGLITGHFHADFFRFTVEDGMNGIQLGKELPPGVMMAIGVRNCGVLLDSGFTGYIGAACTNQVDACLKIAIAEGIIRGPRIRTCGHHINTTADMNDSRKWWQRFTAPGTDIFADGVDDLRKLVREEIRCGAEIIKIFGSQGHGIPGRASRNMSADETAMVVNTAHERGVKVRSHVCDREMILESIELGVDLLDHADEIDEQCIEAMVKHGTYWCPSVLVPEGWVRTGFDKDGTFARIIANVKRMLPIAHAAGVPIVIGDDYSGMMRNMLEDDPLDHQVGNYARELTYYAAAEGVSPAHVLTWATANPGRFLVDAPVRTGIIAAGAKADLIVVDGDPLADLSLLARPETSLKAVIVDGAMMIDRLPVPREKRSAA